MEWKHEVSPEQLLLPFGELFDAANGVCDRYSISPRVIRAPELPAQYEKAYSAASGTRKEATEEPVLRDLTSYACTE
jgi:hypothetical protein